MNQITAKQSCGEGSQGEKTLNCAFQKSFTAMMTEFQGPTNLIAELDSGYTTFGTGAGLGEF